VSFFYALVRAWGTGGRKGFTRCVSVTTSGHYTRRQCTPRFGYMWDASHGSIPCMLPVQHMLEHMIPTDHI
jgi:hypothetical protein